jgi:hypothetical protein
VLNFCHRRKRIIPTWKHYFKWLKTWTNFCFQASGWSSAWAAETDFFYHTFSRSGRGYLNHRSICPCCCYYILLREVFFEAAPLKYISLNIKNIGYLCFCSEPASCLIASVTLINVTH